MIELDLATVTAVATVLIGAAVAVVAFLQWKTAQNKLAIELFDRRFAALQRTTEAASDRFDAVYTTRETRIHDLGAAKVRFADSLLEMEFLFGSDVADILSAIDRHTTDMEHERAALPDGADLADLHRSQLFIDAKSAALDEFKNLRGASNPYMMVDHIAVSKPARPFKWPSFPKLGGGDRLGSSG